MQKDCLFCAIKDKKLNASIVAENDHVFAFRDINPMAPTHILIVPKTHVMNVSDLSEKSGDCMGQMALMAKNLAQKLGVENGGYRLVINNGAGVGQSVFHLHMHFLAGREFSWPPG